MQFVNPQDMKVYKSDTDLSHSSELFTDNDLSRTGALLLTWAIQRWKKKLIGDFWK